MARAKQDTHRHWAGCGRPAYPARIATFSLLLAGVLLALPPRPAQSEEREFATLVALGATRPLQTAEGLSSPIIVVDHERENPWGAGRLALSLKTSELLVSLSHPVTNALEAEYRWRSEVITEGDGRDLYRDGERQRTETFEGDSTALVAVGRLFAKRRWGAAMELERRFTRFSRSGETRLDFDLPPDFRQDEVRLSLERRRTFGVDEGKLSLTLTLGRRDRWRAWALDPLPEESRRYERQALRWHQPLRWSESNRSEVTFNALAGRHLDLFSGFRIGGIAGRHTLPGYFRNEFRARRVLLLNLSHEWALEKDRVLMLYGDAARLRELDLPLGAGNARTLALGSLGVGFRYGIRSLAGLPVILRYGQGLNVPAASKEGRRRELLLVLAAGF
jgi:hypothetical protein